MSSSSKRRLSAYATGLCLMLAVSPAVAVPVTIDYDLTALAAPARYEYHYTVTNLSLTTPVNWFSIDFDAALYEESSLLITSTGLSSWSEQILASVFATPAQYDAYKTAGAPLDIGDSQAGFTVQFTWLGAGTPGSQAFTIYDSATLDVLDSGMTTAGGAPPIPEPSTAALMLLGLVGAAALRRRMAPTDGTTSPA